MIGRFFRKWFGGARGRAAIAQDRPSVAAPAVGQDRWCGTLGALAADEVEDRFYRLVFAIGPSRDPGLSPAEQTVLRRVRETFGGERFDVGTLPRLPAVVPQLMRSLRHDDADSRTLAEQIARDTVLVGEIIRVANSAYFRTARPVTSLAAGHHPARPGWIAPRGDADGDAAHPAQRRQRGQPAGRRAAVEHAERCACACIFLGRGACDPFEAFLAGLVSQTGAQAILREIERLPDAASIAFSRPFVAALAQQVERLSLHAARHWNFPLRVVQALAERADPADAGARTPLGRALLAASRVAMLDVLADHGVAEADAVLLATPAQGFSQELLRWRHATTCTPR